MVGLARFVGRRLAYSALVIVGVLVIVFFLTRSVGDPARLMLPAESPREVYLALRHSLGLDDPLYVQFVREVGHWLSGDFGNSLWQKVPALPLVVQRVPMTLFLTFATLLLALPVALLLGTISALRPGSFTDRLLTALSLAAVSTADYWLALMLILVVAVGLHALPTSGAGGLQYVILPALTLAFRPVGRITQIARSAMLEEMGKPYIVTARARGLSELRVVVRHAMRNAALPMITLTGDEAAALLNGAVVIETIFGWPGIGNLFISAIERRDLPLIEATVLVVALMIITVNLLVDLSYSYLDPRIRRQ